MTEYTVVAGRSRKRGKYVYRKAEVESFAELLAGIQESVGLRGESWSLYDSDWRQIYDLRSFAKAPRQLVYLDKAGRAKLPSIAGSGSTTQRTTLSSPSPKPPLPPISPAPATRAVSEPSLRARRRRHPPPKSNHSVDRNNNKINSTSNSRSSSKPRSKPSPHSLAPPDAKKHVRRVSGGARKKRGGVKAYEKDAEESEQRDSRGEGIVRKSKFVLPIDSKTELSRRYKFDRVIGDGNFAVVSRCVDRKDGSAWAVKEIDKANVKGKVYYIENEVDLMLRCSHPAICRLREAYQSPQSYYLVLDLINGGDLFDLIKTEGTLSETEAATVTSDVANALQYLHSFSIVHRDIKLENLLLTNDRRVKLADFGLACKLEGRLYRVCGTPTYVAAEILAERGYGLEVDVWSLGVILHIMLVGYAPFRSANRETLFRLIQEGRFSFDLPGWELVSQGAKELVSEMVEVEVGARLSARGVLRSPWLRRLTLKS